MIFNLWFEKIALEKEIENLELKFDPFKQRPDQTLKKAQALQSAQIELTLAQDSILTNFEKILKETSSSNLENLELNDLRKEIEILDTSTRLILIDGNDFLMEYLNPENLDNEWVSLKNNWANIKIDLDKFIESLDSLIEKSDEPGRMKHNIFTEPSLKIFLNKIFPDFSEKMSWASKFRFLTKETISRRYKNHMESIKDQLESNFRNFETHFNELHIQLIEVENSDYRSKFSQNPAFIDSVKKKFAQLENLWIWSTDFKKCKTKIEGAMISAEERNIKAKILKNKNGKVITCKKLLKLLSKDNSYSKKEDLEKLLKEAYSGNSKSIHFRNILDDPDDYLYNLEIFNQEIVRNQKDLESEKFTIKILIDKLGIAYERNNPNTKILKKSN